MNVRKNKPARQKYLNHIPELNSHFAYARWALTNPWQSYTGGKAIQSYVQDAPPAAWAEDMDGKEIVIIGSGPSLDKIDDAFFAQFHTAIHINFAIRRRSGADNSYFFTTDIGPIGALLDTYGDETFVSLGPDRCIFAPIFLDQWHMIKDEGLKLITLLGFDEAGWRTQDASLGPLKLPYTLRYHPKQPDWDNFTLPAPGRTLPVLDHTSALTAIIFAAMNGAKKIGLIGCDFSTGARAEAAQSSQALPGSKFFAGAASEFRKIAEALGKLGIEVTNHSWEV